MQTFSRRNLTRAAVTAAPLALPLPDVLSGAPAETGPLSPGWPAQDTDMVREMVIVAHTNLKRTKELVALHPSLVNAAVDWGFGDWEAALGGCSHTGQREIAEFLIANGA